MAFSFARAIATVGGLTLLSRVAGFARDILNAALLGAGPVSDAFFVALKLPNLFRRLFGEGAFSVAFVPLFNAEMQANGRDAAHAFAEKCLAVLLLALTVLTAVMMVAMPWVIFVLAPGFADDPARYGLAVALTLITFPYLLLISLVTLYGGVLNSLNSFGPFAAAPIAFNLVQIAGMGLAWWIGGDVARILAVSVVLSGVVQLVWLARAAAKRGFSLRLRRPSVADPRVRRLFVLMGPAALGGGIMQVNVLVDLVLASLLPAGAVTYLYYADRLNQLPLGVIGIAVGTALLPVLSRAVEAQDHATVRHYLSRGLEFALLFGLPAGVALMVAAQPIVAVLFERGAFGPDDTAAVAATLMAYAAGIPAYVLVKVLSTAWFARQDTLGPVKVAALVAVVNGVLGWALIGPLAHVGIALATCVTAYLNVGLLAVGLHRRGQLTVDDRLRRRAPRLGVAAVAMGVLLLGGEILLAPALGGHDAVRFLALGALVGGGGLAYFALAHVTGGAPLGEIRAFLRRRRD